MKNATLETLVWVLIYGGLALLMLGLWTRGADAWIGGLLGWTGALLMLAGALGVWWRSRRTEPSTPDKKASR